MPTELNWMDLRVATVGPSTNITSQISAPSLWHSIDPTTAAHGPADGMANAPTIVCPPRPKIRAPAPPLVAPPANLMIRSKKRQSKAKMDAAAKRASNCVAAGHHGRRPVGSPVSTPAAAERTYNIGAASSHPDTRVLGVELHRRMRSQRPTISCGIEQRLSV